MLTFAEVIPSDDVELASAMRRSLCLTLGNVTAAQVVLMDCLGCHTYAFIAIRHVCALGMGNEPYELPIWSLSQTATSVCTYAGRGTASKRFPFRSRAFMRYALFGDNTWIPGRLVASLLE